MSEARRGAAAHAGVLTFKVDAKLLSGENYRGRGRTSRHRSKAEREWTRIKALQELIGWRCRQAARPGQLKRLYGQPISLEILLYRQPIDLDNVGLIVNSLKHILYPDDKQQYLKRLEIIAGEDETFEKPCLVLRVAVWE